MTKLNRGVVHSLKNQGKTFAEIGRMFDVSKQYVWSLYTNYSKIYRKSDQYKMYKRHSKGHTNPYKPCDKCEAESITTSSIPSTV